MISGVPLALKCRRSRRLLTPSTLLPLIRNGASLVADAFPSYSNDFPIIMSTIWRRMADRNPVNWRHVYKALLLLDYMIKNGSDQVIQEARAHMMHIQQLDNFQASEEGKDTGYSGMWRDLCIALAYLTVDSARARQAHHCASA